MTTTAGTKPHPIFLAGRWVESDDPLVVSNPAHPDEPAGATFHATEAQYEEAVEAAVAAFEVTRTLPAYERGAILRNISTGIKARREELGPDPVARGRQADPRRARRGRPGDADVPARRRGGGADGRRDDPARPHARRRRAGSASPGASRSARSPAISPFNFPLNLAAHKVAPAIASGNPIVLKPPSKDPLTMLTVAEIIEEAGAPAGSVSVLPMSRELGDRMVSDERFKLLTFTGSPSVGWRMKERAGKKKVVLELGGNAGVIVDKTADLDWAVKRILVGAFSYAGQVCISVQRMFVHEDVWDAFMDRFVGGRAGDQGRRPARSPDRDGADGRRRRRVADPALGRRGGRDGRQGRSLGGKADGSVLPADDPDRRPGRRPRSARTRRSRRSSSRSRSATSATRSARSTTRCSACRPASSRTT